MKKTIFSFFIAFALSACIGKPMLWSPPPWDFESYQKEGISKEGVKAQMYACGYVNVFRSPPSKTLDDLARRQKCMFANGFTYKDGYQGICSGKGGLPIKACSE